MSKFDELGKFYVYCIECFTPNHFYVGSSRRVKDRIRNHRRGSGHLFTANYGVRNTYIITETPTRNIALKVEGLLRQVLRTKGVIVGGTA